MTLPLQLRRAVPKQSLCAVAGHQAALLILALVGTGCATPRAGAGLDEVSALLEQRATGQFATSVQGAPQGDADAAVAGLLTQELTPETAVQVALLNSPAVQATLRELDIAEADLAQARLIKNPSIHGELRFPDRPFEVGLTQDVVDLFLRRLRVRVGSARLRETHLQVAHSILDLASEVRKGFYDHQASLQSRAMYRTIAEAAGAAAELADRQYAAGNISRLDLENMKALEEEARLALAASEVEVLETRERLNRLMGIRTERSDWVAAEHLPELPEREIALPGLEEAAAAARLDFLASEAEVSAARAAIPLARASQFPSVGLGVHLEREPEGTRTMGPSIEVSLPLFDRGQAAAAGARARFQQSLDRTAALATEIGAEVRTAHARLVADRGRCEYYRDVVLPRRERIVAETQREYNFMLVGVYQLLQAKQNEVAARRDAIEARRDYWRSRAELERAVGKRPEGAELAVPGAPGGHTEHRTE